MTELVVNPATGEILEHLDQQPPEALAEALDAVHARQDQLKNWQGALEAELRRRLKIRQVRLAVFGEWEVEASTARSRAWDADELEGVLARLVDDGVVRAGDVAGVIERPPTVRGKAALDLRGRLTGDALAAVDSTWTWKERPGPVVVARSVDLLDAAPGQAADAEVPPGDIQAPAGPPAPPGDTAPEAAEETLPLGGKADRDGSAPGAAPVAAGSPEPPEPTVTTVNPEELFA